MVHPLLAAAGMIWLGSLAQAGQSVPIDLAPYFNHKAFGTYANETTFDTTYNRSYPPLNDLAPDGIYTSTSTGIKYDFPSYTGPSNPDNLICENQTITIPSNATTGKPFSLNMLVANDLRDAIVSYNLTYIYTDGTTALAELRALSFFNWLTITHGEIISPFTWTPTGKDWNTSQIFEFTGSLDPTKTLAAVQLPMANNVTVGRIHVFSMSVWESEAANSVQIQSVRPTQKWTEGGSQVVEVTINNIGTECVAGSGLTVSLQGAGVSTVEQGSLKRLCPGDQKRLDVGVTGDANATTVAVTLSGTSINQTTSFADLDFGFENFTTDLTSIGKHESPQWFDDAKFGIMIHCTSFFLSIRRVGPESPSSWAQCFDAPRTGWSRPTAFHEVFFPSLYADIDFTGGAYSVPAYGGIAPNETYAEWFWWYSNNHYVGSDKSDCLEYRLETFGPDWNYDDGFVNFTASAYDPKEWVDLFADAVSTKTPVFEQSLVLVNHTGIPYIEPETH